MSDASDLLQLSLTAAAVAGVVALPLLQSDLVSRRLLSPPSLQAKRCASYKYHWEKQTAKVLLKALLDMGGDSHLELLVHEGELQDFLKQCLQKSSPSSSSSSPKILSLGVDEHTKEICVWILLDRLVYQVPMKKFGLLVATHMENTLTTTALCFVADASGGLGADLITDILMNCQDDLQVPVVREPTWMAQFAVLVENGLIQAETLEKCLFALCRLEASSYSKEKTVCFTLPGQASTAPLVPLLQKVFPCERHVFIYDSCSATVSRVLSTGEEQATMIRRFTSNIRHSTPLDCHLSKKIPSLSKALADLPLLHASTTECWLTSVNTMLQLKEEEATNQYLPFVCKLSLVLNGDGKENMALLNLLQFISGSRSRPFPRGTWSKASMLASTFCKEEASTPPKLPLKHQRAVENAVFQHKSILLEHKTLLDTVQPTREWSLKQAKKISGCSCCGPPLEEGEDEYNPSTGMEEESSRNADTSSTKNAKASSSYVDGKTMFAFDPTKFS